MPGLKKRCLTLLEATLKDLSAIHGRTCIYLPTAHHAGRHIGQQRNLVSLVSFSMVPQLWLS